MYGKQELPWAGDERGLSVWQVRALKRLRALVARTERLEAKYGPIVFVAPSKGPEQGKAEAAGTE